MTPPPIPAVSPSDRVLVLGAYGAGNVGDEAILAGLLEQLGDRSRAVVISKDPGRTSRLHGVEAVALLRAGAALPGIDTLVIGGGGLFSSHVGTLARGIPPFGLTALALGKRVILHGVSVDHTTPRASRTAVTLLARRAASLAVRDYQSAAVLGSWGVPDVQVAPDLSAHAPVSPSSHATSLLEAIGLDTRRPIVGLALAAVDRRFDSFLRTDIPELVRALPGVQFCFVPMSRHPTVRRHNDLLLGNWLQKRVPGVAVLRATEHPADVIAVFGAFSAAVCMRFHSLVFAERSAVPVVGIPYAAKCQAWLDERCLPATLPGDGTLVRAVRGSLACHVGVNP